jgi:hypothetical protein
MVPCDCKSRPEVFHIYPGDETEFIGGFELKKQQDASHWFELYECRVCKSLWCFENNGRSNIVVKVLCEDDWLMLDMESIVKDYIAEQLVREYGIDDRRCRWKDCENNALHNYAFCPDHLF